MTITAEQLVKWTGRKFIRAYGPGPFPVASAIQWNRSHKQVVIQLGPGQTVNVFMSNEFYASLENNKP